MPRKHFIDPHNAQKFQLVHRSQQDPLISSDTVSQMVFKPVAPSKNLLRSGKWDITQEPIINENDEFLEQDEVHIVRQDTQADHTVPQSSNEKQIVNDYKLGEAAQFGIYFDDQEKYDYLKHLKSIGDDPQAVFVDAKSNSNQKTTQGIQFLSSEATNALNDATKKKSVTFQLPAEALASKETLKVGMLNQEAIDIAVGFEMDPDLRQVMTALNDDAYVEEDLDEDFFDALNSAHIPDKIKDILEPEEAQQHVETAEDGEWMSEFRKFKDQHASLQEYPSDENQSFDGSDDDSSFRFQGPKTATTNHSMTSSAMFRNSHLTMLDDRFDKLMENEYDDEFEEWEDDSENLISKQRLDQVFTEFLDNTEIKGKKAMTKFSFEDELESIRKGIDDGLTLEDQKNRMYTIIEQQEEEPLDYVRPEAKQRDTWDVQTVISTYSNIYNRPRIIKETRIDSKIKLGRDGLPLGALEALKERQRHQTLANEKLPLHAVSLAQSEEEDEESIRGFVFLYFSFSVNLGEKRPKEETCQEKKERKEAVKLEKRNRREQKKAMKAAFNQEKERQAKIHSNVILQERTVSMS